MKKNSEREKAKFASVHPTSGAYEEDSFERDELDLLIRSESDGDQTEMYP